MNVFHRMHDQDHMHKHDHRPVHNHNHTHRRGHSHDSLSIDQMAFQSGLSHINPGFKVAFSVFALIFLLAADNLAISLLVFITMYYLTVIRGGVSGHSYLSLLAIPLLFAVVTVLTIALDFSLSPVGEYHLHLFFFYIYTSRTALWKAFCLFCKVFSAVSCMYFMSLSTPVNEIICVLQQCHLPSLITELMNMIYRFIFILLEVQQKMSVSARSRLGYIDTRTSLRTFGNIGSNLFIVSMKKAGHYYDALLARCYDGQLNFLTEEKPLNKKLVLCAVLYFVVLSMILITLKFL
ncbi:MAG: cobalt ECF transporter T component CbiQ [Lachnospiraceae bacterium]|nr:cobalt ECF transporter T component CbiQ [Lachnospiraceae bacterium]